MAKNPTSIKRSSRNAKSRGMQKEEDIDYNIFDELKSDDDQELEDQTKLIKATRHSLEQKSKKSSTKSTGIFQSRKKVLYLEMRRNAKELVQSSITLVEDMQAHLSEIKTQQTGFQKYYDDYHLPCASLQETFHSLLSLYPPMLDDLGTQRSEKLEGASTMLKENAPRRQDALKEFSKNARQQLEQVKQLEKDAQDATELIKHVKNLLRG